MGPLALQKNGTWYTYTHDLTKNVTEVYKTDGTIATAYDYAPFGAVTAAGIDQPIQWSSEFYDAELGMVYYNFRHYNPMDGRWISRDPVGVKGGTNIYRIVWNNALLFSDKLGLAYSNQSTAARAAIQQWSHASIRDDVEYCGLICRKKGTSEIIYTTTRGSIDGCSPQLATCPKCFLEIAYWHTHGAFIDNDNDGREDRGYDTEHFSGTPSSILLPGEEYGDLNFAIDHDI